MRPAVSFRGGTKTGHERAAEIEPIANRKQANLSAIQANLSAIQANLSALQANQSAI